MPAYFNPRSPYGERPTCSTRSRCWCNFNPRSPYGERRADAYLSPAIINFNPRSPYGERPPARPRQMGAFQNFNPRSPYGERPLSTWPDTQPAPEFQSTLPLRGATVAALMGQERYQISIHAPLTGSDCQDAVLSAFKKIFQSTLPLRGATSCAALRIYSRGDFNPRSPYGERLLSLLGMIYPLIFQSTLPLRGATDTAAQEKKAHRISIHAPLTGSDSG